MAKQSKRKAQTQKESSPTGEELSHYTNTTEQHTLECCICDDVFEMDSVDLKEFLQEAWDGGWRIDTSDKFQIEGAMCPTCFSQEDADRGE